MFFFFFLDKHSMFCYVKYHRASLINVLFLRGNTIKMYNIYRTPINLWFWLQKICANKSFLFSMFYVSPF